MRQTTRTLSRVAPGDARLRRLGLLTLTLSLSLALVTLAGCGDDDVAGPRPAQAELRALHLSPDAPGVDIFLNGGSKPAVENLAFPNGTGFVSVDPGTYTVAVAASGSPASSAVLTVPDLSLEGEVRYTAVAYDRVSSIKALALVDDLSPVPAGSLRVRAVHTASGVGQVDIWNVPTGGTPAPLYPDFDFGEVGDYLTLPAGAYRLGIDVDNDASPDLLFNLPALPAGTVANVFAVSDASGGVFLLAQFADGTTARIDPAG